MKIKVNKINIILDKIIILTAFIGVLIIDCLRGDITLTIFGILCIILELIDIGIIINMKEEK